MTEQQHTPILTVLRVLPADRGWEVEVVPLVEGKRSVKEKEFMESFKVGIGREVVSNQMCITSKKRSACEAYRFLYVSLISLSSHRYSYIVFVFSSRFYDS